MRVEGAGPNTAEWAIIGEAPGYYEDQAGVPFVGPSGKLLRQALTRVGLDPEEAYITNVIKERPPNNETPSTKEIKEALPALLEELKGLPNLRAVLLLGNSALSALTGLGGITKRRGLVKHARPEVAAAWEEASPFHLFATLHPAAILRVSGYRSGWLQDLAAFRALVDPVEDNDRIVLVADEEAWAEFEAHVQDIGALDVETTVSPAPTGTNKYWVDFFGEEQDRLVCLSMTFDGYTAFVFTPGNFLYRALPVMRETDWVMHNGSFDTLALKCIMGIDVPFKHDTMAMAYLLHEDERKALEILGSVWLGLRPYKDVDYVNITEEDPMKVYEMNGRDANRTYRLFRPLANELNEHPALSRLYQWLLMPAVRALIEVTYTGVPVDVERLAELKSEVQKEVESAYTQLLEITPDPGETPWPKHPRLKTHTFNPSSAQQVARVLFDMFNLPVLERTKTGAPSTKDEVLASLLTSTNRERAAWLSTLRTYRKQAKNLSSYLEAWPKLMSPYDLALHPRYKPLHVVTGRLSSEYPNIQNVPRDPRYRDVFGDDKGVWLKADYSQIELRIAAWLAHEPTMLQAYREGQDLHRLTAQLVLGDSSDEARYVAKVLNFSLLYGAGWKTLQTTALTDYDLLLTDKEAQLHRDAFFSTYASLEDWHQRMRAEISRSGVSVSPLGRVRHLPDARIRDSDMQQRALRQGINHPVQSFASDLLLMSLARLREPGVLDIRVQPVAEVHDELDFFFATDVNLSHAAATIKGIMEDVSWLKRFGVHLTVPIIAELSVGTHWGSTEELVCSES